MSKLDELKKQKNDIEKEIKALEKYQEETRNRHESDRKMRRKMLIASLMLIENKMVQRNMSDDEEIIDAMRRYIEKERQAYDEFKHEEIKWIVGGDEYKQKSAQTKKNIAEENYLRGESILKQLNKIDTEDTFNTDYCEKCIHQLKQWISNNFFRKVSDKCLSWKSTNVFAHDKNYSLVWKNLRSLNKTIGFLNEYSQEKVWVRKTHEIYEFWCYYKILHTLLYEQNWQIQDGKEAIRTLSEFLYNSSDATGLKKEISITLEHDLKNKEHATLEVCFNKELETNKIKVDGKNGKNRPDFSFVLSVPASYQRNGQPKTLHFYLDAKYRNYDEQEGEWKEDIVDVAIEKYIECYKELPHESSASFIVHTVTDEKFTYFGGGPNPNNNWPYSVLIKSDLAKSADAEYLRQPKHRYGSFVMLPEQTDNILLFLKMLFEYHGNILDVCWNCGEANIEPLERETHSDKKYYYSCGNCNEFWVNNHCWGKRMHRLIKHTHNYHTAITSKKNPWMVVCPECLNAGGGNRADSHILSKTIEGTRTPRLEINIPEKSATKTKREVRKNFIKVFNKACQDNPKDSSRGSYGKTSWQRNRSWVLAEREKIRENSIRKALLSECRECETCELERSTRIRSCKRYVEETTFRWVFDDASCTIQEYCGSSLRNSSTYSPEEYKRRRDLEDEEW